MMVLKKCEIQSFREEGGVAITENLHALKHWNFAQCFNPTIPTVTQFFPTSPTKIIMSLSWKHCSYTGYNFFRWAKFLDETLGGDQGLAVKHVNGGWTAQQPGIK